MFKDPRYVSCALGGGKRRWYFIDSGANGNVISRSHLAGVDKKLMFEIEENPRLKIRPFGGVKHIAVVMKFKTRITCLDKENSRALAEFLVIDEDVVPIIGAETAMEMNLLRVGIGVSVLAVEDVLREPAESGELPYIPIKPLEFEIDESVAPVRQAYCNIPACYLEATKKRLEAYVRKGITEKVTKAPRWISGLQVVPKGREDFRLVVNMRAPNKAIHRQFHRMPRIEEMSVLLHGAKYFTVLDVKNAFHHVRLARKSRELTTFLGPDGMYRFKRLVFGVNCAPEIFQRLMEDVLRGIQGAIVYIDDILIYCSDMDGLKATTKRVLEALERNNLTLNDGKCQFEKDEVVYLGHKISAAGMNVSEQKIETVRNFRVPRNLAELKGFIGFTSFINSFIPGYARAIEQLRETANRKQFSWSDDDQTAFVEMKRLIEEETITRGFFCNDDETFLYTDAGPTHVGAVLMQREKGEGTEFRVISTASKKLSRTEENYSQQDREALSVVWGCEHFYYFLLGHKFTIRTDAQALVYNFTRNFASSKHSIRRFENYAMRLNIFDYKMEYVKGKDNYADAPSRLSTEQLREETEEVRDCEICVFTLDDAPLIATAHDKISIRELAEETETDEILQEVIGCVETGVWPHHLKQYKALSEELRVVNGVVMRWARAVIPSTLRMKALRLAHEGHMGIVKTKAKLRAHFWWPGMTAAVENWVKSCGPCMLASRADAPVPMRRSHLPEARWDSIAVDYAGSYMKWDNSYVLVVKDYYSRYMIATRVSATSFEQFKKTMDRIFDRWGFPRTIRTDNGPPFNSVDLVRYCRERDILIEHSTPLDPQQNGMVENSMQLIGAAFSEAAENKTCPWLSLRKKVRGYNTSVHTVTRAIPEEVMMGRRVRRQFPLFGSVLDVKTDEQIRESDWNHKLSQKVRVDRSRRARANEIKVNDEVVMRREKRLKGEPRFDRQRFKVIAITDGDLTVSDSLGKLTRRNVTFAKKIHKRMAYDLPSEKAPLNSAAEETLNVSNETLSNEGIGGEDVEMPTGDLVGGSTTMRDTPVALRPQRQRKKPDHLNDYVMMVDLHQEEV